VCFSAFAAGAETVGCVELFELVPDPLWWVLLLADLLPLPVGTHSL